MDDKNDKERYEDRKKNKETKLFLYHLSCFRLIYLLVIFNNHVNSSDFIASKDKISSRMNLKFQERKW
jgi:hypothetical protein